MSEGGSVEVRKVGRVYERKGDAWVGVGISALPSTHSCGQYKQYATLKQYSE